MVKIDIKSGAELVALVKDLRAAGCARLRIGTFELEMGAPPEPEPRSAGFMPSTFVMGERDVADMPDQTEDETLAAPRSILEDPDLYDGRVPSLPRFDSDDE